jgi:hypothetical protein
LEPKLNSNFALMYQELGALNGSVSRRNVERYKNVAPKGESSPKTMNITNNNLKDLNQPSILKLKNKFNMPKVKCYQSTEGI